MLNEILIGLETNIGQRKTQQDAAIVSTNDQEENATVHKTLAVLCDGMGGMEGGEKASNLCVNTVHKDFYGGKKIPDVTQFLFDEIDKLDIEVAELCDGEGQTLKAGTTLVAVIIEDNKLYWASVGDSRLYIIRNEEILQVTKDHNYLMELMEMVKQKRITLEEAISNEDKEALVSYIGIGGIKYVDYNRNAFELLPGDCMVMCSDGLYRALDDESMKQIVMASNGDMSEAAKYLVEEAMNQGNKYQDNTTVVTIKYQ